MKDQLDVNNSFVEGKIDSFDMDSASIVLNDGQKISWPKDKLPPKVKVGSIIYVKAIDEKLNITEQEQVSKSILNKLLGNN
ncbi:DUF3006 domain-containing protein [Patescibacteria group bacterium]|nr:DUF3006 domain-containing protein [Patescibacteria group bacterium]